jgi:sugar phosphate isomerase/epimerase
MDTVSAPKRNPLNTPDPKPRPPFTYCLNTSTVQGQKLSLVEEVDLAAKAGYGAIEPWIGEIERYRDGGGSLADLRKRIADAGLRVAGAIGFAKWVVDDAAERAAGLEHMRRDMDLVAQIGGTHIAAPPVGHQDKPGLDLRAAGERYAAVLAVGRQAGVTPMLEVWGFSKSLSRLSEALFVAAEARDPDACLLLDTYHLHRGGSGFDALALVAGHKLPVFHVNDFPASIAADKITDADRVYPGDGAAPYPQLVDTFTRIGARLTLSLELFNKTYWAQDALTVAKTGLAKLRQAVEAK